MLPYPKAIRKILVHVKKRYCYICPQLPNSTKPNLATVVELQPPIDKPDVQSLE